MSNDDSPRKSIRPSGHRHTHPAASPLNTEAKGGKWALSNLRIPKDLHNSIRLYSVFKRDSVRNLTRMILRDWMLDHKAKNVKGLGVKPWEGVATGKPDKFIVLYLHPETHIYLRLIADQHEIKLRDIILPVLAEWAAVHCADIEGMQKRFLSGIEDDRDSLP